MRGRSMPANSATVAVKPCRKYSPPTGPISPAAKKPAAGAPASASRDRARRRGPGCRTSPRRGRCRRTRARRRAAGRRAPCCRIAERLAQVAVGADGVAGVQAHDLAGPHVGADGDRARARVGADQRRDEEVALHVVGLVGVDDDARAAGRRATSAALVARSRLLDRPPAAARAPAGRPARAMTLPSAAVMVSSGPSGAAPCETHGSISTPSKRTPTAPPSSTSSSRNSAARRRPAERRTRARRAAAASAARRRGRAGPASVGNVYGSASRIAPAAPVEVRQPVERRRRLVVARLDRGVERRRRARRRARRPTPPRRCPCSTSLAVAEHAAGAAADQPPGARATSCDAPRASPRARRGGRPRRTRPRRRTAGRRAAAARLGGGLARRRRSVRARSRGRCRSRTGMPRRATRRRGILPPRARAGRRSPCSGPPGVGKTRRRARARRAPARRRRGPGRGLGRRAAGLRAASRPSPAPPTRPSARGSSTAWSAFVAVDQTFSAGALRAARPRRDRRAARRRPAAARGRRHRPLPARGARRARPAPAARPGGARALDARRSHAHGAAALHAELAAPRARGGGGRRADRQPADRARARAARRRRGPRRSASGRLPAVDERHAPPDRCWPRW